MSLTFHLRIQVIPLRNANNIRAIDSIMKQASFNTNTIQKMVNMFLCYPQVVACESMQEPSQSHDSYAELLEEKRKFLNVFMWSLFVKLRLDNRLRLNYTVLNYTQAYILFLFVKAMIAFPDTAYY